MLELVQLGFIVAAHSGMMKELLALYVRPTKIWNIYVSTLLCYAALYFTCFCYDRASFNVDGYAPDNAPDSADGLPDTDTQTYNDVPTIFIFFLYFSFIYFFFYLFSFFLFFFFISFFIIKIKI